VGQARAVEITLVIDEYLRLVNETPEGRRMDDAIAIALVLATVLRRWLGKPAAFAAPFGRGARRQFSALDGPVQAARDRTCARSASS
jgi:hypothetical protein